MLPHIVFVTTILVLYCLERLQGVTSNKLYIVIVDFEGNVTYREEGVHAACSNLYTVADVRACGLRYL